MHNLEERFAPDSIKFYGVHSQKWFSANEVRDYQLKYENKKEGISFEKIELISKIECGYPNKKEHLNCEIRIESGASLTMRINRNGKLIEIKCGNMQAY